MSLEITWLGHASFRLTDGATVIYIDPWKLADPRHDATAVLVSHSHHDHFSLEDIGKITTDSSIIIAPADALPPQGQTHTIKVGQSVNVADVQITATPAYNPAKKFHPQDKGWLGFLIEWAGQRIYYAGDTDLIPEMDQLPDIDLALLPVGGTYTMDKGEAAQATERIKCRQAIPYHWGDIVGDDNDARLFVSRAHCDVTLLAPGQCLKLD